MATLTVPSGDLSKALSNAEAWLPAKSPVPVALFAVGMGTFTITVTDTYTAGEARCPVEGYTGHSEAVEVSRADLIALAKRARQDGTRKTLSRITVETGAGVILHGAIDEHNPEPVTALAVNGNEFRPEWAMLDELFTLAESREPWLLLNPAYMTLFNKVRPDVAGRGAHLVAIPEIGPVPEVGAVFGKVGKYFRALVMTLDEKRNEAALGEGGLW
ncbi:hypothetical protein GCM10010149_47390 [Nonomuraea roseoviolacea subsp. roseoviolacea]|uniref:hypothetical protein n=1 Tax=Nonomuraea roseoviolacea TaxID=103837 RepID=UPI0031DF22F6